MCTDLYEAEVNHKEEKKMKKKTLALVLAFTMTAALFTGCGSKKETETTQPQTETAAETESEEVDDQAAADEVAALIDAIYVQTRNENTDEQCAAAKAAWDKLTDAQKELVEGENADPDYFGRDTGDASKDDPLNEEERNRRERAFSGKFWYILQRQQGRGYRWCGKSTAGSKSGLVCKKSFHSTDHHQPCTGKRW